MKHAWGDEKYIETLAVTVEGDGPIGKLKIRGEH
jgi:hypothetical protein